MMRLQCCADCHAAQYPSREFCGMCLSDRLVWKIADAMPARVLARTVLHHSNEVAFRDRLPLAVGLVQFDTGPVAVCFLPGSATVGQAVQIRIGADDLLEAA
jgi:uncharacterized OB-fold protein